MEKFIEKICKNHGLTTYVLESRGYYRCRQCRQDHVAKNRIKTRIKAIDLLGGKCIICGYDKCNAALQFHHRDPSLKKFNINNYTCSKAWKTIKEETKKCDLLCANCHMELHFG
jgi:hypothetical protein